MSDGQLILAAAALLAAGNRRIPACVANSGCPDSSCSWLSAWRSARTARAGSTFGATPTDYELARTIGVVAPRADPVRGGPSPPASTRSGRCSGRRLSLAIVGTLGTCIICGFRRGPGCFDLSTLEGDAARARSSRPRTARPSSRSCASRPSDAGSPGRSRARPAFQRPGRGPCSLFGFIDWIQLPELRAHSTCSACSCARWEIGAGGRPGRGGRSACGRSAARGSPLPGLYPGRDACRPSGLAYGGARHGWHGLRVPGRVPCGTGARLRAHTREADGDGVPPGPRVGRPDRDVPHARPAGLSRASLGDVWVEGDRPSRWCSSSSHAPCRCSSRPALDRFSIAEARRAQLGGPTRRGAGRARHVSR